jgi:hypothetical protein
LNHDENTSDAKLSAFGKPKFAGFRFRTPGRSPRRRRVYPPHAVVKPATQPSHAFRRPFDPMARRSWSASAAEARAVHRELHQLFLKQRHPKVTVTPAPSTDGRKTTGSTLLCRRMYGCTEPP